MKRSRPWPIGVLFGAFALLAGSCSDGGGGSADTSVPDPTAPATTVPATTAPGTEVTVLEDVAYEYGEVTSYAEPPLMDVYAPPEADGLPLVVLLHGGGVNKDVLPVYATLPEALATRGAVVAVPNWARHPTSRLTAETLDAVALARCAIGFAVEHAKEWGADPNRVTLLGHSGGANIATTIAFDPTPPPPSCPASTWDLDGVVLWEGDWALANPSWEEPGLDVAPIIPVLTPWAILDGWAGPVTFVVTADSVETIRRCDDIDTWLPVRDPAGTIRAAFDEIGALDDGCFDVGDMSKALAQAMTAAGVANTYLELTGTGSNHTQLSGGDLELMAEEVYEVAVPHS